MKKKKGKRFKFTHSDSLHVKKSKAMTKSTNSRLRILLYNERKLGKVDIRWNVDYGINFDAIDSPINLSRHLVKKAVRKLYCMKLKYSHSEFKDNECSCPFLIAK